MRSNVIVGREVVALIRGKARGPAAATTIPCLLSLMESGRETLKDLKS